MTTLQIFRVILIASLLSCNNRETNNNNKTHVPTDKLRVNDSLEKPNLQESILQNDTIKRFIVEDYPVTYEIMAEQKADNSSSYKKVSGKTQSLDKAWFTNDTLKQTLIFELYTDGYRSAIYHFTVMIYSRNI